MQIELKNAKTGDVRLVNAEVDLASVLEKINKPNMTNKDIFDFFENIELQADLKALLKKIIDVTVQIGNATLHIGKKILEFIYFFVAKFPNTSTGIVVGSVLGMLISSIPVIGFILGWMIPPLCIALGLGIGFWHDMTNPVLAEGITKAIHDIFGGLSHVAA
mgnify:CR=1 FL=1